MEILSFEYKFHNNSLSTGLNIGELYWSNGSVHSTLSKGRAFVSTAYLSVGMNNESSRLSLYPAMEAGVAYGNIDLLEKQTRFAYGLGITLQYQAFNWMKTGLELKYFSLSNSDSSWLMLGFKIGFCF